VLVCEVICVGNVYGGTMKSIVKLTFSLVYISLMGLISPIWLGFMYILSQEMEKDIVIT